MNINQSLPLVKREIESNRRMITAIYSSAIQNIYS